MEIGRERGTERERKGSIISSAACIDHRKVTGEREEREERERKGEREGGIRQRVLL